jgi:hypothetical protein
MTSRIGDSWAGHFYTIRNYDAVTNRFYIEPLEDGDRFVWADADELERPVLHTLVLKAAKLVLPVSTFTACERAGVSSDEQRAYQEEHAGDGVARDLIVSGLRDDWAERSIGEPRANLVHYSRDGSTLIVIFNIPKGDEYTQGVDELHSQNGWSATGSLLITACSPASALLTTVSKRVFPCRSIAPPFGRNLKRKQRRRSRSKIAQVG